MSQTINFNPDDSIGQIPLPTASIHDDPARGGPRPVVIKGNNPDYDWLIMAISLILILVFAIWLVYNVYVESTGQNDTVALTCPVGQCPTNIFNGIKRCPTSNVGLTYDPTIEVCNQPTLCDNNLTPYAVQNDGSTSQDGQCPANVQCRCLQQAQCSNNILVAFAAENGNPYTSLSGQRLELQQVASYVTPAGTLQNQPPISIVNPLTTFCSVPNAWVERIRGGGCISGVLAYLPDNPQDLNIQTANNIPLGCVVGAECPVGFNAYWDKNLNQRVCTQLCPDGQETFWNNQENILQCVDIPNS